MRGVADGCILEGLGEGVQEVGDPAGLAEGGGVEVGEDLSEEFDGEREEDGHRDGNIGGEEKERRGGCLFVEM